MIIENIIVVVILLIIFFFSGKKALKLLKEGNCSSCNCTSIDINKIKENIKSDNQYY